MNDMNLTNTTDTMQTTTTVSDLYLANDTSPFTNLTTANITMVTTETNAGSEGDDGAIYFEVLIILATYFYPLLIFGGVVCNILSIVVLQSKAMHSISISVYLTTLAVIDSLVLLLDFINNYLKGVAGVNALAISNFLCTLYRFSFDVVFTMSAWLVVAVTVERLLIVWFPLKVKTFISVKKAWQVSTAIFASVFVYKLYNFWVWEVRDGECDWKTGWESFHTNLNMPLTFAAYSYLPLVILVVCNTAIVVKLWRQQRNREDMTMNSDSSDTRRLTLTVLVISSAYLLLTVPLSAYYTIQYADQQFIDMTPQMALGEMMILMVGLSNHSINFFFYILSSRSFRKVLIGLFHADQCCTGVGWCQKSMTKANSKRANNDSSSGQSRTDGSNSDTKETQSMVSRSLSQNSSKVSLDEVEVVVTTPSL